jgi:8-oxo-dGTP pyrophosphatase MutT (NUDIX family)
MLSSDFLKRLEAACALDVPYTERLPRAGGTPAAVLMLLGVEKDVEDPSILITRRTDTVETHKGQMAFPGGMGERGETDIETALRETEEEVGIPREKIKIMGRLPEFVTVTDFTVTPIVGVLESPVADTPLRFSPDEIAEALWVPLSTLKSADCYRREWVEYGGARFPIHAYYVGRHRIWGATGSMIQNFLVRLASTRN